jgi:hypothetical protein
MTDSPETTRCPTATAGAAPGTTRPHASRTDDSDAIPARSIAEWLDPAEDPPGDQAGDEPERRAEGGSTTMATRRCWRSSRIAARNFPESADLDDPAAHRRAAHVNVEHVHEDRNPLAIRSNDLPVRRADDRVRIGGTSAPGRGRS